MARANPLVSTFNGGELSPLLTARVDNAKVAAGCARIENFGCTPQGPLTRRPGFLDRASTKRPDDRAWLLRFEFGTADNYILECGDKYFRFFAQGGRLMDSSGRLPFEVAHPYAVADLASDEGTLALSRHQEGDVLYLAQPAYFPQTLTRSGALAWQTADFAAVGGPWNDLNTDQSIVVTAGAQTGTTYLASSADLFTTGHIGVLFRLFLSNYASIRAWEPGVNVGNRETRLSDGKFYLSQAGGTTGSVKPTHDEGIQSDGKIDWEYRHSGYGWAEVIRYQTPRRVQVKVLSLIPDAITVGGTERWQFGAWAPAFGFPACVGLVFGRLAWGQGRTLHFSAPDDFPNYEDRKAGRITADGGFSLSIKAAVNIRWIAQAGERVIVGTDLGEYIVRKLTETQPFASDNADITPTTNYGCRRMEPRPAHGNNLFVSREGRRLIEQTGVFNYSGQASVQASERSIMAEHLMRRRVVSMCYQATPWSMHWMARADGSLIAWSYQPEHEVYAFCRHPTPKFTVECVEGIPDTDQDQVWALVRVHGKQRVVQLAPWWMIGADPSDAVHVDLCQSYVGPPTAVLADLAHLEGETVAVYADGAVLPPQVVSGGAITLSRTTVKAFAGLPIRSLVDKRNVEAGGAAGTSQTLTKRSDAVGFRLLDSGNVKVGPGEDHLELLDRRAARTPFGVVQPLLSGDYEQRPWNGDYDRVESYVVVCDEPRPCTLLAIVPRVEVEG